MKSRIKKIIYIVSFSLLIVLFVCLLIFTRDSKKIVEVTEFIKTDTKVLYITSDKKSDYPVELLNKYGIDYLKIDNSQLSIFEIKRMEAIVESKQLNNLLVIYKSGKIIDSLKNYKEEKEVEIFLQKHMIIPNTISDNVSDIMDNAEKILDSTYSMVYIPYYDNDENNDQDEMLKDIAKKYSIEYKRIDAYLLSNNQQQKINNLLGLSLVEDQILILVKDKKMIANIRGVHSKNTYIENLYDVNFINELENKINEIDYDLFKEELNNKEKSVILIGSDDLKDSNQVFELLNNMIYNYDIKVNYINIKKEDIDTYNKIKEEIEKAGYNAAFSLPIVIIAESGNILDYAVGNSKEEYFIEIFVENGVIKGESVNE